MRILVIFLLAAALTPPVDLIIPSFCSPVPLLSAIWAWELASPISSVWGESPPLPAGIPSQPSGSAPVAALPNIC